MIALALRFALLILLLSPAALRAEPVTLTVSFFTSDRSGIYQCQIRPFVDAVNAEGAGLVEIKVLFSGALSPSMTDQPKLVREGKADLAQMVPGTLPREFADTSVLSLPGLYRDERESSRVFMRLVEAGALQGYQDYVVLGAFVGVDESIHSRKPLASLADLKGQTIRVNNPVEASMLRALEAKPVLLPINRTMDALSDGTLDGVTIPPWMMFEFGFGRLTDNHYLIHLSGAPVTLIMNRAKFASLPAGVQDLLCKFGGDWLSDQQSACGEARNSDTLAQLRASARRKVTEPTAADLATLTDVYASVVRAWAAESPHNTELLARVKAELARLRKETPR